MAISSIVSLLQCRAAECPEKSAYTFLADGQETDRLTFAELEWCSRAVAAHLQERKLFGERAVLLYPPGIDYISAFYGCIASGVVAVPAYPPRMNRNLDRIESIIEDAQPAAILTTSAVWAQLKSKFSESPLLAGPKWILTDQISLDEAANWADPNVGPDTLAFLQYTSASTSKPKGVMVSHGNVLHNEAMLSTAVRHHQDTVIVSWLPMFHDMGLISTVLGGLYNAVSSYLLSPVEFLKRPNCWLEAISRYRGTFSGGPDFAYQLCLERIQAEEREGLDLSSWETAFSGSEPIRAATVERFIAEFEPQGLRRDALYAGYGLAEYTLFATGCFYTGAKEFSRRSLESHRPAPLQRGTGTALVNCGAPIDGAKVAIVDPDSGQPCEHGEIGEIWLAGGSVAQGYWNQPELTKTVFHARLPNGDGPYLRTGDLGFLCDGGVYITGRLKDLIIIRGRNLIPQDIEQTVEACDPSLRPAHVAAVSVEAGGAERLVIVAEVRREARRNLTSEELVQAIRTAVLRNYEVDVSAIVLLRPGALPKTSSGKTQRAKVRQGFLAKELVSLSEWRDERAFSTEETPSTRSGGWGQGRVESWLVEKVAAHAGIAPERIDRTRPALSYGLDSVVTASLVSEMEKLLGIRLDLESLFDGEPGIRDLAARVLGSRDQAATSTTSRSAHASTVKAPVPSHDAGGVVSPQAATSWMSEIPSGSSRTRLPGKERQVHLREHPFRAHVNPELGRALSQIGMDKTFVRGEGCWLWDEDGRRYLDFLAQYGALPFGFNPAKVWEAFERVRVSGEPSFVQPSFLGAASELAERLIAAAPPGMTYVTFANSGAETIEAAIKLCRSTTGRQSILSAGNGFHGKTLGALSATHKKKYQKPFGAPFAGFDSVPYGDLDALQAALKTRRYAGFLIEPLQGEGGIVEAPAGYLRQARKLCREAGTLFVADEIQTGLGRTGAMFVCRELGITPDILTVAKALGGGLVPVGACLSTAGAYNSEFGLNHTSTFAGNTLACRAGLATLDLLEENSGALLAQVSANGARLKQSLLEMKAKYPGVIAEVRGRGYFLGVRFGLHRYSVEEGILGFLGEQELFTALIVSHLLHAEAVRVGYTLNQGGVLRIEPPLTAGWHECECFLSALERVVQRVEERDLAGLTSQVTGYHAPRSSATPMRRPLPDPGARVRQLRHAPREEDARFAFLVHPLAWSDYGTVEPLLAGLSDVHHARLSDALADNFDPFVIGETRIEAKNGRSAYGEFILVPRRAKELADLPRSQAVAEIGDAVRVAQQRGAKIVGLGAFTSVVTQGGLLLKGQGLPALTTGNSFTAAAALQTIERAAGQRGVSLASATVAIIGAGGAVGQALSILLSRKAGRLILVGNPAHPAQSIQRLCQVAGRMVAHSGQMRALGTDGSVADWILTHLGSTHHGQRTGPAHDGERLLQMNGPVSASVEAATAVRNADVVVCCTSSTEPLIRAEWLRPSAIVCDVSRPGNVGAEIRLIRPDVLALEGAVVKLPGEAHLSFNCLLPWGHVFACMAETMIAALERRYENASLGFDLQIDHVLELVQLADRAGFEVVLEEKRVRSESGPALPIPPAAQPPSVQQRAIGA